MLLASVVLPGVTLPPIPAVLQSYGNVAWYALVHFVLGILWYAPFFAWVGLLSTVFRRWSMPLAILIPVVFSLLENATLFGSVPTGGYIYNYLTWRLQFGISKEIWFFTALTGATTNVQLLVGQLLDTIDWRQLGGGLVVAAVLIYLASLFRRRGVTS